jgi:hypothetical protein
VNEFFVAGSFCLKFRKHANIYLELTCFSIVGCSKGAENRFGQGKKRKATSKEEFRREEQEELES